MRSIYLFPSWQPWGRHWSHGSYDHPIGYNQCREFAYHSYNMLQYSYHAFYISLYLRSSLLLRQTKPNHKQATLDSSGWYHRHKNPLEVGYSTYHQPYSLIDSRLVLGGRYCFARLNALNHLDHLGWIALWNRHSQGTLNDIFYFWPLNSYFFFIQPENRPSPCPQRVRLSVHMRSFAICEQNQRP